MTIRRKPGVDVLGSGLPPDGGPIDDFLLAVVEKMKTGLSKPDAIKAVVKADPELHAAYVQAHNARVGPSSYHGSTLD
jgi:hypothetical protein